MIVPVKELPLEMIEPDSLVIARGRDPALPTRMDAILFALKRAVFCAQRLAVDLTRGPSKLARVESAEFAVAVAVSRTALWSDPRRAEIAMQQGKVHNLRAAARLLDLTLIPAGATFSFWRQLGRASRQRGFVPGRMLQEGCMVAATGGGLCQLSNALYDAALQAGCEIVERHAHSRLVPGSAALRGRDATVAWNYVDLRFRSRADLLLRVQVERDELVVGLFAVDARDRAKDSTIPDGDVPMHAAQSCGSCGETSCFRHNDEQSGNARRAFVVDEYWTEFDAFIAGERMARDVLCLPLDGRRRGLPQYGWSTQGFANVGSAVLTTVIRGLTLRLAPQGPARREAELRAAERLARRLARYLAPDVTEIVVAQTLLPYLWRDGHLGGRKITVLMTRLPMGELQARLDAAARLHPERGTLSDFRADPVLMRAEAEALAAADSIVTPHAEIAALFGERAILLDWTEPKARIAHAPGSRRIAFPGPTIARKGAYELREAARALDLEVVLLGSELEGEGFWRGVRTSRDTGAGVAAVVQQAIIEDKPRRLLAALASGIPVIATRECGLPPQEGLTLIPANDSDALIEALRAAID